MAPNNPNSAQPFRLGRDQAQTCDQDHTYTDEQKAFDSGLMDKFVETVGRGAGTGRGLWQGKSLGDGLPRRQHRYRHVELRPALRHE